MTGKGNKFNRARNLRKGPGLSRGIDERTFFLVWVGCLSVVVILIAIVANFNLARGKLKTEMAEHWHPPKVAHTDQRRTGAAFRSQPVSQAAALEQTFNRIARSINKVTVSITSGNSANGVSLRKMGSGVLVAPQHVLSNLHVVNGARSLSVTVYHPKKRTYPTKLVRQDLPNDLAVLKILTTESFPSARLGNSDIVDAGDIVFSIGNPFGFGNTITSGIISEAHQSFSAAGRTFHGMLQTSTDTHEGSSGGPLINIAGEVIGINTAVYAPRGAFTGIGFATPINRAAALIQQSNLRVAKNAGLIPPCPTTPGAACPPNCTFAAGCAIAPNCTLAAGTPANTQRRNDPVPALMPRTCPNCNAQMHLRCPGCRRRMTLDATGENWVCPASGLSGPGSYFCPYCRTPRNQDNNNPFRVAA